MPSKSPEAIARKKQRETSPEGKAKQAEYQRTYFAKPGVKARRAEADRERWT